jgi:hypothetical protein
MDIDVPQNLTAEAPTATELLLFSVLSLFIVALLNTSLIHMPPVWDVAPGVFAPAIYLYETGFDFRALFSEHGYIAGGPNVHSISLVTLLTAFVFWLTKGAKFSIPILHGVQFVFTAVALTATYQLARLSCGRLTGGLLALTVLVFPVFRVQTGYLYTEILGAALVLLTLYAWVRQKYCWAIFLVFLACVDKSLGLPIAGALAVVIAIDANLPMTMRARYLVMLIIPVGLLEYGKMMLHPMDSATIERHLSSLYVLYYRLTMTPDLLVLICIALLWVLFLINEIDKRDKTILRELSKHTQRGERERVSVGLALFLCAFLMFFLMASHYVKMFIPLVRYYVWILPLLLLILIEAIQSTIAWASRILCKKPSVRFNLVASNTVLIASVVLCLNNSDGNLYPNIDGGRKFSIAERSLEYLKYYDVQKYGVESVAYHDQGLPVFVTRGEYYFLSSPLMGYVPTRIKDLRLILRPPYDAARLRDYPSEFMLLDNFSNGFHGQTSLRSILREVRENNRYEVMVVDSHANGLYRTTLYRIIAKQKPLQ